MLKQKQFRQNNSVNMRIKLIAGLFVLGLIFISASLAPSGAIPTTSDEYFNTVMESFFGREDHFILNTLPNDFPDTSLHYQVFARNNITGYVGYVNLYARRQCSVSPSDIYYMFYLPLDTNAYWNAESFSYNSGIRGEFKHIFGEDILKDQIMLPVGKKGEDSGVYKHVFRFFNGKAFTTAFKILYKKPDAKFNELILQKIYNVTLKDYDRDAGNLISHILTNKKLFKQWADNYILKAKTDTAFDGITYADKAGDTLIGKAVYPKVTCMTWANRLLGIMMRRQCDGTLPDLLTCFKTVLKDYDPEYYSKIKDNF